MQNGSPRDGAGPPKVPLRRLDHRLYLTLLLVFGATAWEHVIHTFVLGEVDTLSGHLTHILRDGMLALPLSLLAVWVGASLAARVWPAATGGQRRLVVAAITAVLYGMLMVPSVGVHQQLDSHGAGALAGGHAAHQATGGLEAAQSTGGLALHGLRDAAVSQVVALPLLLVGLALLAGSTGARRRIRIPMRARLAAISTAATAFAMLSPYGTVAAQAQTATALPCSVTRTFAVSAIDLTITLNRFGDNDPFAYMYALDSRIPAIRAAEKANAQSAAANQPAAAVSPGLREDVIQPLMLRANLGECVRINFTNRLTRAPVTSNAPTATTAVQAGGVPAVSISPQGVAYDINNQGDAVGNNPNSLVPQNGTRTYTFYLDPALGEGGKVFRSGGDSRELTAHGLFGAILAEPAGSHWLDPETAADKTSDTSWANWEAIIDPASGPSFREFGIMYHEVGDEFFNVHKRDGNAKVMVDGTFSFAYRPAGKALNYRSEPFLNRLDMTTPQDKAEGYSSYPFGDPATPIPRSYLGEPTKTRLMHPGSEQLHVHHLHGGGDRWRANPGADNTDIAGGLEKVPLQSAKSIRLDSQTIGPDESYNLEHECGAGGCQQAAGDYLYHCHIAHHYIAGMWSFWRVFDTLHPGTAGGLNGDTPLAVIPGRAAPPTAVNSAGLLGRTINAPQGPRTVVLKANLTNPATQIALEDLVENQIPPAGQAIDRQDAAVWDWIKDDTDPARPVYKGEVEQAAGTMTNYESPTPGQRPAILFNPTSGRYTWPLLRPHSGQRPPFSPNGHSGAPWLGENTSAGRPDGLCPSGNPTKNYNITSINTPVKMTDAVTEPNGEFFVLSKDRPSVTPTNAQPLAIRSNVGDCVAITFTNEIDYGRPDQAGVELNHKVNMHTHFVQFDPQASDGVITGLSFEQAVRSAGKELTDPAIPTTADDRLNLRRTLTAPAAAGATTLQVNSTERLHQGSFIAVGQGLDTIEITQISKTVALTPTQITLERPLTRSHATGESTGVEFVQYRWYSDVDSGTVFWHDHVDGIHSWSHGLFGAHIIEPKGSDYLDPRTLQHVDSGANVVIKPGTGAASPGVDATAGQSFREFMIWLHNGRPSVNPTFNFGQECEQGSINVRAEPFAERVPAAQQTLEFGGGICPNVIGTTDPYVYSSVKYGDPITPLFRAYVGDPVVVRTIGLDEKVDALRIQGHRFRRERFNTQGELMDAATTGISERFDYVLEGGAGGPGHMAGDYLYYSTRNFAKEQGGWGIFRVHDRLQSDLKPLPDRTAPPSGAGFPLQTFTGGNPQPPSSTTATTNPATCPSSAPVRAYTVSVFDMPLPLQETIHGDRPVIGGTTFMHDRIGRVSDGRGIVFSLLQDEGDVKAGRKPLEPLAVRARAGDCVRINLVNHIQNTAPDDPNDAFDGPVGGTRAGFDLAKLITDPQRSGGSAVGFNADTTAPQNTQVSYTFRADKEVGTSIFLNAGSQASQLHGAYGALIVEPSDAAWFTTNTGAPLTSGAGTQAIIRSPRSGNFRELVVMPSTTDAQHGRSLIGAARRASEGGDAYEDDVIGYTSINYHNEPLAPRLDPEHDLTAAPLGVPTGPVLDPTGSADHSVAFSSSTHGDPDPGLIFRTFAGDPVRFRVAVPATQQFHVFNVAGHEFPWEPTMTGSQLLTGRSLTSGETQEAKLVGNAGGTLHTTGDYLVQDARQPFARSGGWGLFRVLPTSGALAPSDLAPVNG
jgi:manganese oxidase